MIKPLKVFTVMLLAALGGTMVRAVEEASPARKTAIFVTNRAGAEYDGQLPVLEDFLAAKLSDSGFSLMSRELMVAAASKLDPASENPNDILGAQLEDQSSALRLAQGMGADYLLSASITSISKQKRNVNAYGVQLANYTYTLRVSYKVVDAAGGGSLTGGVATATKTEQNTVHANQRMATGDLDEESIVSSLFNDATTQIAAALRTKVAMGRIAVPKAKAATVTITINVQTADLYIPDVQLGPQNTVSIKDGKLAVAPLEVTVEVDGLAVGSAPGKVTLKPGLSKLRLTREGYQTWERTINAVDGQSLNVAMQMSPEGLARWQELTVFMNKLKDGAKLTDAQVQVLLGQAQMLRQSGFKVDTSDAPTINVNSRSLFDW
ncbi:MAG: hypothetical protein RIS54_452 [Verrucomicrobiota bacterium]|jgi:hypothetical protein